jgi:hypothetical protein
VFHHKGLPEDWDLIVGANVRAWDTFTIDERVQLSESAQWLLRHKHWEAANHFELNDEILTTLAIQASVLILGLDESYYRDVSAIIVYPTTVMSRGTYAGPVVGTVTDSVFPVLGEAHDHRGPIIIAWDEALHDAQNPGRGKNVVFHEFAHKIDMLDDVTDGTPPLKSAEELARWVEVCTEAYEALQEGHHRPPLDPYGATNPAEFFAVATEAFFDAPVKLQQHELALYEVLRDFYGQEPSERARHQHQ